MPLGNPARNKVHLVAYLAIVLGMAVLLISLPYHLFFFKPADTPDISDLVYARMKLPDRKKLLEDRILIINTGMAERDILARICNRLDSLQPRVVGIDLIFDQYRNDGVDTAFSEALHRLQQRLVLVYNGNPESLMDGTGETVRQDTSLPLFSKGHWQAYSNLGSLDGGYTARTLVPYCGKETHFSVAVAGRYDPEAARILQQRKNQVEWIHYSGRDPSSAPEDGSPPDFLYLDDWHDFLSADLPDLEGLVRDKIVLLGFCGETPASLSYMDKFFTPFNPVLAGRSFPDMHGVFVHANIIAMILDQAYINEVPYAVMVALTVLVLILNFYAFDRWREGTKSDKRNLRILQFLEFNVMFFSAIYALYAFQVKIGLTFYMICILPSKSLFDFYKKRISAYVEKCIAWLFPAAA